MHSSIFLHQSVSWESVFTSTQSTFSCKLFRWWNCEHKLSPCMHNVVGFVWILHDFRRHLSAIFPLAPRSLLWNWNLWHDFYDIIISSTTMFSKRFHHWRTIKANERLFIPQALPAWQGFYEKRASSRRLKVVEKNLSWTKALRSSEERSFLALAEFALKNLSHCSCRSSNIHRRLVAKNKNLYRSIINS